MLPIYAPTRPNCIFSKHQAAIEQNGDEDVQRMVGEYDPDGEFVTVLFKTADRMSTYRVEIVAAARNETVEKQVEHIPESPDLETLMTWEAEGGCKATDGCWVEPDGACSHGYQSWLTVPRSFRLEGTSLYRMSPI